MAPIETPVFIALPELGIVSVSGADAVSFLQTQLTSDVARSHADQMQLSGYCTPKGRLLATFHLWRSGETVFLRMPREVIASLVKRLSMFVLRAKAKVTDVSDEWSTHALVGDDASDILADAGIAAPSSPYTSSTSTDVRVDRVLSTPSGLHRFLLTQPAGAQLPLPSDIERVTSDRWWLSEIEAAVPTVFAATQEKFVPQMINFEVLGGVDFKKGCYPGQEIVARSQYLGKLKRRMSVAHVDTANVQAAADVFTAGSEQPVGTVVMAAPSAAGSELLFEAPLDRTESGTLHLHGADGPPLTVHPLPYALFDPTE
jgi:folate-binding protein YgfZ